jgi:hypothetical protein
MDSLCERADDGLEVAFPVNLDALLQLTVHCSTVRGAV